MHTTPLPMEPTILVLHDFHSVSSHDYSYAIQINELSIETNNMQLESI